MAIYLFSQILKFISYSIKLIEKLSRRHFIKSSDVFVIKGFTVELSERRFLFSSFQDSTLCSPDWTVRRNATTVHVISARIMQRFEQYELLSRQVF